MSLSRPRPWLLKCFTGANTFIVAGRFSTQAKAEQFAVRFKPPHYLRWEVIYKPVRR